MNSEKLAEILASHSLWLASNNPWLRSGEALGECANLRDADLRGVILQDADLRDANLRGANLRWTNLENADLRGANLRGADFEGANLHGTILASANLEGAHLRGANFGGANFGGANLQGANLQGADLIGANLQNANLRDADFRSAELLDANLRGANLRGANLRDANLAGVDLEGAIFSENWQIVPPMGQSFAAFKKTRDVVVLELLIPGSAQRTSSLIGRKCRTNEALVVGVAHGVANDTGIYKSLHRMDFTYEIGKTAREPAFDPDIRVECTAGIHFFLTKEEAIDYR